MTKGNDRIDMMLSNAAGASQHKALADNGVVRGALLRSIHQWLTRAESDGYDINSLIFYLENHPDYDL